MSSALPRSLPHALPTTLGITRPSSRVVPLAMTAALAVALASSLSACGGAGRLMADVPDAQKAPRTVAIKLVAANKLNLDARGQSLALVTRVYKLRQRAAFDQAPFDTFLTAQKEQQVLGADLLEVKEIMLIPGQRVELAEKVSREAGFVGVVALYHTASPQRWRVSMPAAEAEKADLTVAANACALSVAGDIELAKARPAARCQ